MERLKERVSYLKGLAEGLNISDSSNEGKVLKNIIEVMGEFADAIADMDTSQGQLEEYIEQIDSDLADIEEDYYDCSEDDDLDEEYYELECPVCHDTIVVDEDTFDEENEIVCPNCKNEIEIEFEGNCHCGCEKQD